MIWQNAGKSTHDVRVSAPLRNVREPFAFNSFINGQNLLKYCYALLSGMPNVNMKSALEYYLLNLSINKKEIKYWCFAYDSLELKV